MCTFVLGMLEAPQPKNVGEEMSTNTLALWGNDYLDANEKHQSQDNG